MLYVIYLIIAGDFALAADGLFFVLPYFEFEVQCEGLPGEHYCNRALTLLHQVPETWKKVLPAFMSIVLTSVAGALCHH